MGRPTHFLLLAAAALLGGDAIPQSPQIVRLKDGSAIYGRVESEEGVAEVVVNTFNSRHKAMTLGVERIPAAKVGKIEKTKNPWGEYVERAKKLGNGTVEERLALAKGLRDAGFKSLANEECVLAHLLDPNDPAPAKAAGDADWKRLSKSDPRLDPELKAALEAYLAEPSFAARKKSQEKMAHDFGYPRSFLYLERALRSKQQKKGRQDDRVLSLRSKANKGVYTLFVPSRYDPLVPTPLVLALHGGGNGGKDGKDVVGSGTMAMNFYQQTADRRGMIIVCPTAIAAPWAAPANEPFLLACLEEVMLLYNVDENRVYLTGHSMGGFGAWSFGPKHNELFAVVAPMSGGGSNSFAKLKEMGTGVYVYHGADDAIVKVGDSRRAGETMRKDGLDFIYTEVPNSGHTLPSEVVEECFDFFEGHRLHATPDRGAKGKFEITKDPLSSFDRKVSADEREYLEDPLKAPNTNDTIPALLADLRKGGGSAEAACAKIAELNDAAAQKPLAALLLDPKESADVRAYAARTLGKLRSADAVAPLSKAIAADDVALWSACAEALGEIGDKKGAAPLREGLKRAAALLKAKTIGANKIDYSDWERVCQLSGVHVAALQKVGDPAAAPDIAIFPGEGLLLATFDVDVSPQAGQNADKPKKKLGSQTVQALEALANPACAAALEKLKAQYH
jgi:poly(3-hydroxybutyrate) depolymerase